MHALSVDLAERSYPVLVGPGARDEVARFFAAGAKSAVIVTRRPSRTPVGSTGRPGVPAEVFVIPDGEDAKTLATVEGAHPALRAGRPLALRRGHRGGRRHRHRRRRLRRPTYLPRHGVRERRHLAAGAGRRRHRRQDGVNLPEGKNLVGAFWQPNAVLCDTETLATLPPREWACGRGEIAKYAFLGDAPHGGPAGRGAGGALRRHQGGAGGRRRARHPPDKRVRERARDTRTTSASVSVRIVKTLCTMPPASSCR